MKKADDQIKLFYQPISVVFLFLYKSCPLVSQAWRLYLSWRNQGTFSVLPSAPAKLSATSLKCTRTVVSLLSAATFRIRPIFNIFLSTGAARNLWTLFRHVVNAFHERKSWKGKREANGFRTQESWKIWPSRTATPFSRRWDGRCKNVAFLQVLSYVCVAAGVAWVWGGKAGVGGGRREEGRDCCGRQKRPFEGGRAGRGNGRAGWDKVRGVRECGRGGEVGILNGRVRLRARVVTPCVSGAEPRGGAPHVPVGASAPPPTAVLPPLPFALFPPSPPSPSFPLLPPSDTSCRSLSCDDA